MGFGDFIHNAIVKPAESVVGAVTPAASAAYNSFESGVHFHNAINNAFAHGIKTALTTPWLSHGLLTGDASGVLGNIPGLTKTISPQDATAVWGGPIAAHVANKLYPDATTIRNKAVMDAINSGNRITPTIEPWMSIPPGLDKKKLSPGDSGTDPGTNLVPTTPGGPIGAYDSPQVPSPKQLPLNLIDLNDLAKQLGGSSKGANQIADMILKASNIPYGQLSKSALKAAKASVAADVKQLMQQQAAIRAEGERIAKGYQVGAQATAQLSAGLPTVLQQNYDRAAKVLGGLAAGYANAAGQTADQQAAGILSSPSTPAGSQPITSTGQDVSQYGLPMQHSIYGNADFNAAGMVGAGLAAANARTPQGLQPLQSMIMGQGLQSAQMARGAAEGEAEKLLPDIEAAQAKRPTLYGQFLNDLVSNYQKGADLKIKALQNLQKQTGVSPVDAARLMLQAQHYNMQAVGGANANALRQWTAMLNANTRLQTAGAGANPFMSVPPNNAIIDKQTGQIIGVAPPKPAGPPKPATVSQRKSVSDTLRSMAKQGGSVQMVLGQPQFVPNPQQKPTPLGNAVAYVMQILQIPEQQAINFVVGASPIYAKQWAAIKAGKTGPGGYVA